MSKPEKKPPRKRKKPEVIHQVPLEKIQIPDERITSVTPSGIVRELKDSIAEKGILQPLQLIQTKDQLILTDGLHRLKAAFDLGMKTVPCIIRKGTDEVQLIENLILNRQRGKSDPVGEGIVLRALVRDHGMTVGQACRAVQVSHTWGKKLYDIVSLSPEIREMISHRLLPVGSAAHLIALENPEKQLEVATDAVKWNYSVEQTKHRVKELLNPDHEKPVGSYEFTEAGQPQRVLPECFACGNEIPDRLKYAYFHVDCFEDLKQAMAAASQKEHLPGLPEQMEQVRDLQAKANVLGPDPYIQSAQKYGQQRYPTQEQPEPIPQAPLKPVFGINLEQLQCRHEFRQHGPNIINCAKCGLLVTY